MDRTTFFFATAIAAALALVFGQQVGIAYYGRYEPAAALRGIAIVGVIGLPAAYFVIRRLRLDRAAAVIFAAIVAYYYGQAAGYRWFFAHDDLQAKIYGMSSVFILALIPGELVIWPIVRRTTNALFTEAHRGRGLLRTFVQSKVPAPSPLDPEALWASIENGRELAYEGRIDRDFSYFDGRTRKERVRMNFSLRRDTMAMTPRERAAYYVLLMLQRAGLDDANYDRLLFALTWANGGCRANWTSFTCDPRVLQQIGMRTGTDVIGHEAAQRNANVDAAISELYTMLRAWAASPGASKELKELQESMVNPAPLPRRNPAAWA